MVGWRNWVTILLHNRLWHWRCSVFGFYHYRFSWFSFLLKR